MLTEDDLREIGERSALIAEIHATWTRAERVEATNALLHSVLVKIAAMGSNEAANYAAAEATAILRDPRIL